MASQKIIRLLQNPNFLKCRSKSSDITIYSKSHSSWDVHDKVTHTGHTFDPADRARLARFTDRPKEVNPNWAAKLIEEVPPAPKHDRIVSCDGGGGALGHPKVYINLDKPGNHSCGYCGLRFYKEDHH